MSSLATTATQASSSATEFFPVVSHLLSAVGQSEMALHQEVSETSAALTTFIGQMSEQFQVMSQRNVELEGRVVAAEATKQETQRMHTAQMQALEQLTQTVNQVNTQLSKRLSTLENRMAAMENKFAIHTHNYPVYYYQDGLKYPLVFSKSTSTISQGVNSTRPPN